MADAMDTTYSTTEELVDKFGKLAPETLSELQGMLRLYNIDAQELFFKWESYCMKMGGEDLKLSVDTAKAFKKDVQDTFEVQMKSKAKMVQNSTSKATQRTPKNITSSGDMFGLLEGMTPATPRGAGPASQVKRKIDKPSYETPLVSKTSRMILTSSPNQALSAPAFKTPLSTRLNASSSTPFNQRKHAGQSIETLNPLLPEAALPLSGSPGYESRVQLTANVEVKKISYRPMHQKLTEASEYLDDRIDEYALAIQKEHKIPDEDFGNPADISQDDIVVVGRIVSDSLDGKLNIASLLLESSRRMGAGARVRLKLDSVRSFSFFPGMLVAFKGVNASGDEFAVSSILGSPYLGPAATPIGALEKFNGMLSDGPLSVVIASGPYTTEDNLLFESLVELCDKLVESKPDVVILTGPFIDIDHPMVAKGDFDIDMEDLGTGGAVENLFKSKITSQVSKLTKSFVIMVPSTRDAVSKHVSFPQEPFKRVPLGIPKEIKLLPNPCMISFNEIVFGITSADILFHISNEEVQRNPLEPNRLARLAQHVIHQKHFYPLFPPPAKSALNGLSSMPVDVAWLRLCEIEKEMPDVMILPSGLGGFAKVVESVVTINPGYLSKPKGPGTYASMVIQPVDLSSVADREKLVTHKIYNRARVDVVRI